MRLDHAIFRGPLKPDLDLADLETPSGYRSHPAGKKLPEKMKAWQVQLGALGKEIDYGLVSDPYGFEDSPDAEWISSGVNSKGPLSVALGRHGTFFLWGFAADPTQMTESGKQVFLNVLHYMKGFQGKTALVERISTSRDWATLLAGSLRKYKDDERIGPYLRKNYSKGIKDATELDPDRLEKYLAEHVEHLSKAGPRDLSFDVDADLVELKVSNRKPAFFEAVIKRLSKDPADEAARRLLARYAEDVKAPTAAEALSKWFGENRKRLFFSDVGGYRWYLAPP